MFDYLGRLAAERFGGKRPSPVRAIMGATAAGVTAAGITYRLLRS
jgi:hypothetical protein